MIPASVRIFVCTVPQDMRRSFDGLSGAVRECLGREPQDGGIYVFVGKSPTRIKALWWDKNGFCLLAKRLHRAMFKIPVGASVSGGVQIDGRALAELLAGVSKEKASN